VENLWKTLNFLWKNIFLLWKKSGILWKTFTKYLCSVKKGGLFPQCFPQGKILGCGIVQRFGYFFHSFHSPYYYCI